MHDLFEFSTPVESLAEMRGIPLSPAVLPNLLLDLLKLLQSRADDPYEREIMLVRYFNVDDRPFLALFHRGVAELSSQLGQPYYVGEGERYDAIVDYRGAYFESADHAICIALWQRDLEVIASMLTGHDADSLLTLTLGIYPLKGTHSDLQLEKSVSPVFSISGDLLNCTIEQVRLCVAEALNLDMLSETKPEVYIENDVFHLWIHSFISGSLSDGHFFLVNASYQGENQEVSDFVNCLAIAFHQHGIIYNFEFYAEDSADDVQIIKHPDF